MKQSLVASAVVVVVGLGWLVAGAGGAPVRWEEGSGLSEPKVEQRVNPTYPEEARAEGVTGVVVLEATIDPTGTVVATTPVQDPDARLTKAATEAVRQWRFAPARTADGEAVAVIYTVTVAFKLQ